MYKLLLLLFPVLFINCSAPKNKAESQESKGRLAVLRDSVNENVYKDINAVVAYHHGKVFIEEYYNQTEPEDLHDARSVGSRPLKSA